MAVRKGLVKKENRKTILLLCDDIRMHSGIATMAREIVSGTVHKYNWVQLAAAIKHPDDGKALDLSKNMQLTTGVEDADVKIYPNSSYGDAMKVRALLARHKPSALMIFTDPRYWGWLFDIEREIRQHIPIFYLNIWDDYPAPYYNRNAYDSCDLLMGISKQTVNINKIVLGDKVKNKVIKYVPHGINENTFFKIDESYKDLKLYKEFKDSIVPNKDLEFVVFFNSRNIKRKSVSDLMLAYRYFCDMIGDEASKKCALLLHTKSVDPNGTDLVKVKELLFKPNIHNVIFSQKSLPPEQMKWLYNASDLTVLPSSNEGWGLSLTESMMCETMIAANVTGGMQDQMRFVDEKGKWIDFDADFPSNHTGRYKECGEWAIPIFPNNRSLVGSVPTPYIWDDKCTSEAISEAIKKAYDLGPEERKRRGKLGREWVMSNEAQMTGQGMSNNVIDAFEETFIKFKKRSRFDLIKVEDRKKDYITHKLKY